MNSISKHNAFSLIEALVTIFIISIGVIGLYVVFTTGLKTLGQNKTRQTALAIAEEKIEYIRNLPYNDIGTQTGIPQGVLLSTETIIQNNISFTVETDVVYVDDPFDGTIDSDPPDNLFTDYKNVRISVSWPNAIPTSGITLISTVTPKGLETATEGGTLLIVVSNASGEAVSGATVQLKSTALGISEIYTTDSRGEVLLPGAPAGDEVYDVIVTKTGYSSSQTYQRTIENPNPTRPPLTVRDGQKTTASFKIDLVSSLVINTVSQDIARNIKINTDTGDDEQKNPALAIDSEGNYYFVWEDNRISGSTRIYAQKYNKNLESQWNQDLQISTATKQTTPKIAIDKQNNLYIVWSEESQGNQEIYLVKYSSDGNSLWTGPKKVSTDANSKDQFYPNIIIDSQNNIFLVWVDNRNSTTTLDVYAQKLSSDGNRLWKNDIKINSTTNTSNDSAPAIEKDSQENIYISWQDDALSDNDIYWQKISSNGELQWTDEKIVNLITSADQSRPKMSVDSVDNFYFVWQDFRNGDYDIFAQKYDSSGTLIIDGKWGGADLQINSSSTYDQKDPCIAIYKDTIDYKDTIYIAWTDLQNNDDIYAQKLDILGNAQWNPEAKMNTDVLNALQNSPQCLTNISKDLIATWQDNRNGNFDIYAGVYSGPGSIVPRGNVPLIINGSKQIGDDPVILKYEKQKATNASGMLTLPEATDPATELEWDEYSITIPVGSGYSLKSIDPAQPIVLEPNTTVNVTLTVE